MFQLTDRRVLITGGTQGVGAEIAIALAKAGADVLLVGLQHDQAAEQTLADCRQQGVKADLLTVDLSQSPDRYVDDLITRAEKTLPGIDTLINNAGTYVDVGFLEMDLQRYQRTMNLNVTAGYFLTQAFAKRWVAEKVNGRVLFTGSINGLLAEPDHTAYDTSKGAVAAMVRSLCVSLAPHGIRVNSIAPGLVRTPLTNTVLDQDNGLLEWMQLHTPNGQVPPPEVCAGAAVFLLSDEASHIHGQTLYVDGGMSVWQQPDPPADHP
ncbi:SDR family oxidoreductase [Roseiconus nitratireducens]|uniref:SDR family oxidoreductase n=1 Tax=Roseiconus nitratireducens TaxID=2605748 RepID=A0A5M6D794_9BACT|nr:SDR family oxidoreductase [Roseiconus nitratireducens]KAA5543253.1 SDR family oxidoreductase [Roseiconus nitratireducens]